MSNSPDSFPFWHKVRDHFRCGSEGIQFATETQCTQTWPFRSEGPLVAECRSSPGRVPRVRYAPGSRRPSVSRYNFRHWPIAAVHNIPKL